MNHLAIYNPNVPSFCRGHPLIEAMPVPPEGEALAKALYRPPSWDPASAQSSYFHFAQVSTLLDFNLPRPECALLIYRLWSMLVNSYRRRHPFDAETVRRLSFIDETALRLAAQSPPPSDILAVLGWSGLGKTTMVRGLLNLLPRTIEHRSYKGQPFVQKQVLWLSVDAPINGSPKGLLLSLAKALDLALGLEGTGSYEVELKRQGTEAHKVIIARALASHYVGLIHIDDLQRIGSRSSSQMETAASTIISLANVVGASLLFSGTPDAEHVLTTNFEVSRRASRRGIIDLYAEPGAGGAYCEQLMSMLFSYQMQPGDKCVADGKMKKFLADLSAAIPAIFVSLYVATQETAILDKVPMTPALFARVRTDQFRMLVPALTKLNKARAQGRRQRMVAEDALISKTLKEWREQREKEMEKLDDVAEAAAA